MKKTISLALAISIVVTLMTSCARGVATWPRELETNPLYVWNDWPYETIFYYSSWQGAGNVSKMTEACHGNDNSLSMYSFLYDTEGRVIETFDDENHRLLTYEKSPEGSSKVTIMEYSKGDSAFLAKCVITVTPLSKDANGETFLRESTIYPEPKREGVKSYWDDMKGPKGVKQKITYSKERISIVSLDNDPGSGKTVVERTLTSKRGRIVEVEEKFSDQSERSYTILYDKEGNTVKFGHNIYRYGKYDSLGNWLDMEDLTGIRFLREITYR